MVILEFMTTLIIIVSFLYLLYLLLNIKKRGVVKKSGGWNWGRGVYCRVPSTRMMEQPRMMEEQPRMMEEQPLMMEEQPRMMEEQPRMMEEQPRMMEEHFCGC